MSDAPSNTEQNNDKVSTNLLAKAFFDKLRRDGPMRDKVGQSFVRLFSQAAADPLKNLSSHSATEGEGDLSDEIDDTLSESRRFRQLRIEIVKEFSDMPKDPDSNPAKDTHKK
jgi:hypothetical protein